MKSLFLLLVILISYPSVNGQTQTGNESAQSTITPWGGYWWSMLRGELVVGWDGTNGRKKWSEEEVKNFADCTKSYTRNCVQIIKKMSVNEGRMLSPIMKYDLYVRKYAESKRLLSPAYFSDLSSASLWEFKNHYIGENTNHRLWDNRGFSGKCIGWALATMDWNEPTVEKKILGIIFTPADIKGILTSIYQGAQFFTNDLTIGTEYHVSSNDYDTSNSPEAIAARKDVGPKDFILALQKTVKAGKLLEADLDPTHGVWNYPIYKYDLNWKKTGTTVKGSIKIYYPSDEVEIDAVFSTQGINRIDMKNRTLEFTMTVPENFKGDFNQSSSDEWTGDAINQHPDAIILGMEPNWRKEIYLYKNTDMKIDVNFEILKRVKIGKKWVPIVDVLLKDYYSN